jgi:hypothetical protein
MELVNPTLPLSPQSYQLLSEVGGARASRSGIADDFACDFQWNFLDPKSFERGRELPLLFHRSEKKSLLRQTDRVNPKSLVFADPGRRR